MKFCHYTFQDMWNNFQLIYKNELKIDTIQIQLYLTYFCLETVNDGQNFISGYDPRICVTSPRFCGCPKKGLAYTSIYYCHCLIYHWGITWKRWVVHVAVVDEIVNYYCLATTISLNQDFSHFVL